mgnify:CR=1 FL=1
MLKVARDVPVKGFAHITGGGLLENIPRVLPTGTHAVVDADAWEQPRLMAFKHIRGCCRCHESTSQCASQTESNGPDSNHENPHFRRQ